MRQEVGGCLALFLSAGLTLAQGTNNLPSPALLPRDRESRTVTLPKLTSFDYRRVDIDWRDGCWVLCDGDKAIKDFGRNEAAAQTALRIIQDLQLTQYAVIGTPRPIVEYWLTDGHAPRGFLNGQRPVPIDTARLRVEKIQGIWCVQSGPVVLFAFGSHEEEARQTLLVIRQYGFSEVGFVGGNPPAMMYFLAGQNVPTPMPAMRPDTAWPNTRPRDLIRPARADVSDSSKSVVPAKFQPQAPPSLIPAGRQLSFPNTVLADAAVASERIPIDWRQARVRNENHEWKLVAKDYTIANFGPSESDARTALRLVQSYHFTEKCRIGGANSPFSYFLVHGRAPRGIYFGTGVVPLHPQVLGITRMGEDYVLAEGSRVILNFGDQEAVAKQALKTIQRYQFDHLCRVGLSGEHSMSFFVRSF